MFRSGNEPCPHAAVIIDPWFWILLLIGLLGWFLPRPAWRPTLAMLALLVLAEETVFRFGLQQIMRGWTKNRGLGVLSLANVLTSAIFAGMHLVHHPPIWALATFFPSLAFGLAWDRYRRIWPCWTLHMAYNMVFFYRMEYG